MTELLVGQARSGDRVAFSRLVSLWHSRLLRHAYRLLNDDEQAQDAVQDSWADIIKGLKGLYDDAAFPAWAYRIVTRRALQVIRKAVKNRSLLAAARVEPLYQHVSADDQDYQADRRALACAIAQLPGEQKAAIALYYLEDLSISEISVALDIPVGTVKTRLMHARKKLRAALTPIETQGDHHG